MSEDAPVAANWSIPQVTIGVSIVAAILFWCCAASAYASRDGNPIDLRGLRPRAASRAFAVQMVGNFAWHSVAQIPSAPWVIGYVMTERRGLLIGGLVVEALIITGGMGLQMLERRIDPPRKKKRKRRKIAMPVVEPD
ncbi:hypothetical protein [Planctellipticum variicoloris]|uniref:hypothetical protein n=1 Tax=Planctellipticum variicoloris TaxID=3064265 RepID=UPI002CD0F7F5|nr:hypothetical protein SH412_005098 [Planctomycetaceae bacterium SH412]HTN01732.1 hypothetical protein [Planctomycetaceae bacterium]